MYYHKVINRYRKLIGLPFWFKSHNKYRGKMAVVIGNGPSLEISDLHRLINVVTIASNRIFLAYENTIWRPTYLTVADRLVWEKNYQTYRDMSLDVVIPSFLPKYPGVKEVCFRDLGSCESAKGIPFSDNGLIGFYGASTVTYYNLQIAAHLGCNPIYLIGCDHFYAGEKNVVSENAVIITNIKNHFHPDYRKQGELVNPAPIDLMDLAYRYAREWSDQSGVKILNATRGGYLEAFNRVSFDDVFPAIK